MEPISKLTQLIVQVRENLKRDLSHVFEELLPVELIEAKARSVMKNSRERIFTPVNTVYTMLLSAIQEDKSLQRAVNLFKDAFDRRCAEARKTEAEQLQAEKQNANRGKKKRGRPKKFLSCLLKSFLQPISSNTAAFATARKNLDKSVIEAVYEHSTDFGGLGRKTWHGMETFIIDGTYCQLQDTEDIKSEYAVEGQEASYPQALLLGMIKQGTGQISQYVLGNRQQSELELVIPMINKMEKNKLLLVDDLYNTYFHFCLVLSRKCHIIVPGKRKRNYKVLYDIGPDDQVVRVFKTTRPKYVSKEEWEKLPESILLRRITYTYPTKNGLEKAVLYTTILTETITAAEIIAKYTTRWDIEITIREIKTLMDINVLRSKTKDMLIKELLIALTAYNFIRKIIVQSADKVSLPPKSVSFKNTLRLVEQFFWTRRIGYSLNDIKEDMNILLIEISKHLVPHRNGKRRHYSRKTKQGKYQKYQ